MPAKTKPLEITTDEIIAGAETAFEKDIYANFIQVSLNFNEMFLDLYYLSPGREKNKPIKIKHIQRIITPVAMAKGLAASLANVVATFEAENNITLSTTRPPSPEDKIKLWD